MEEDRTGATGADRRRLTVPEAAEVLGVTVDAVRGRIRRGKLEAEHDQGAVYVWIEVPEEADSRRPAPASQRPSDDQAERVEDLREQVAYLREQLDREREVRAEERRRQDTIIAQLAAANAEQARTIRLGSLEAPASSPETRESTVSPGPGDTPTPATGGPHAATERPEGQRPAEGAEHQASTLRDWTADVHQERRPWWRRVFGG